MPTTLPIPLATTAQPASLPAGLPMPDAGSRRRRLWELPSHAHCPVAGCCVPMPQLRRLMHKVSGQPSALDDYELHCTVVQETRRRGPLAESLHKELDQRYALPVRQAARLKSEQALADWWAAQAGGPDVAAALWATLTHPRCTPALEDRVLAQVHMLQHQVGTATRVDRQRLLELEDERARVQRELDAARARHQQLVAECERRVQALDAELVRTRGRWLAARTAQAQAQERLADVQALRPHLPCRVDLEAENRRLALQLLDARQQAQDALDEARRQRERAEALETMMAGHWPAADAPPREAAAAARPPAWWARLSVLCVGGRPAAVPLYRWVVERGGGRFLHHDGGAEDHIHRLDPTLAAADLVICQTGCVSHDAYWRVKDHCKRTGKRCLFVDSPSRSALERALGALAPAPVGPPVAAPQTPGAAA